MTDQEIEALRDRISGFSSGPISEVLALIARIDELKAQVRERDEEIARLKERMSTLYRIEPLDVSKLIDQAVADEKARGGAR